MTTVSEFIKTKIEVQGDREYREDSKNRRKIMRTIETKVYTYDELSDEAKEKACNWYRDVGLCYEWWDYVYEDAKQCAAILGIDIDEIYFSGFWSQGDGACFEGTYQYKKGALKAIKEYAPNDVDLHSIAKRLQETQRCNFYKLKAAMKQNGYHCHSGCMSVNVYNKDDNYRDVGSVEDDITDLMREFADWIYSRLEKEYEYLNSDEVVEENIIANEYEFTKEGDRA